MLHTKFHVNRPVGSGEDFDRFLPYRGVWWPSWSCFTIYGHGGHLGHVTSMMSSDFHFLVPESFHAKFG